MQWNQALLPNSTSGIELKTQYRLPVSFEVTKFGTNSELNNLIPSYNDIIEEINKGNISRQSLMFNIFMLLFYKFPYEGIVELLEIMETISEFHERKSKIKPVMGIQTVKRKIRQKKSIIRETTFIVDSED